jgi:hypothetical protein
MLRTHFLAVRLLLVAITFTLAGCVHYPKTVQVIDILSGKPVPNAKITEVYPSFNGDTFVTDIAGVARIKGFLNPNPGCSIRISAPGYEERWIQIPGTKPRDLRVTLNPVNMHVPSITPSLP